MQLLQVIALALFGTAAVISALLSFSFYMLSGNEDALLQAADKSHLTYGEAKKSIAVGYHSFAFLSTLFAIITALLANVIA